MGDFFRELGIKPKIIDYGEDSLNNKYRGIDKKNNMAHKKKKTDD